MSTVVIIVPRGAAIASGIRQFRSLTFTWTTTAPHRGRRTMGWSGGTSSAPKSSKSSRQEASVKGGDKTYHWGGAKVYHQRGHWPA